MDVLCDVDDKNDGGDMAIDDASNVHHSTTRLPINISLDNTSMLTPTARGRRPKMVVVVVNRIGLRRCLQAFIITSSFERFGNSPVNLLNVSIRTILLFTTIPDKATIAIPFIVVLKGFPMIIRPTKTPTTDINTALSTSID